jgi:sigma-B regulation protein RsbU (phosphoserine phosphatase)
VAARWKALYAKLGWVEKLFLLSLVAYFLFRYLTPTSPLRSLAQIAATFLGVAAAIKLARTGIRKVIWRLRNRLVVAYLFIAVVPIVLILVLVGLGGYSLTGQIAVYLVSTELDRRAESLIGPAQGLLITPAAARADRIRWMAPYLEQRFKGLEMLILDRGEWRYPETSRLTAPPAGWKADHGLMLKDGRLYVWGHVMMGDAQAVVLAPLTREIFGSLVTDLGQVTFLAPLGDEETRAALRESRRRAGAGEDIRIGRLPPPANRFDVQVTWFSLVPVAVWERPGMKLDSTLGVASRPWAVLRTLFVEHVERVRGIWFWFFLAVASMLLLVELVSLIIGVSLSRTITGAVHNLHEGTQRVMRGDFSHRIEVHGNDQLADLGGSFNRMIENLERLVRVETEKERMQSELEIAREVQAQLYPKTIPKLRTLELVAICNPARTVSGDYYDYLNLHESRVAIAVGDVAGKGISAALLMATVQSSLRTQIRTCLETAAAASASGGRAGYESMATSRLVSQLNQQLYAFTSPEKFATFYFGVYDDDSGVLTYTNAGHPPPILIRQGEALRLETNGMVVGAFPFSDYGESRIELTSGDLLVCFTDGITEPENEYGEMFGEDLLIQVLLKNNSREAPDIIHSVMESVRQWTNSPELQDDMTLLLARRR